MSAFAALGDRAFIAPLPQGTDVRALFFRLRAVTHVVDVVITETRVAIYGELAPGDLEAAEAALRSADVPTAAPAPVTHVVHVRYDGEDLDEIARSTRMSANDVIQLHATPTYEVRMMGFAPGFAYLGPLPSALQLPRRAAPRVRVPAGSVGIAAHYTGIYPFVGAGGWNLIGRIVDFAVWDGARGATFALGDRVRFEVST